MSRILRRHGSFGLREDLVAHTEEATLYPMRPERRKRHHYIPRFLQKHFCEADGMLWYGIRDTQEVKRVSPRDAFVEKELYTSYQKAHECPNDIAYEPDDRYEREFAELEDRAAPAIEKVIEGTRRLIDAGSTDLLRSMSPAADHCLQGAAR